MASIQRFARLLRTSQRNEGNQDVHVIAVPVGKFAEMRHPLSRISDPGGELER
jgi:hypothetical protein